MNFDPNMMNPEMMKNMMESFSQMSDDQLASIMSSMGKIRKYNSINEFRNKPGPQNNQTIRRSI